MSNKTYSLVAWTEDGEVRMIPSLINECSLPYRQRIAELESQWGKTENEVGLIIAQSRAHEDLFVEIMFSPSLQNCPWP